MMARTCIPRSWKSLIAATAVFLLFLILLPAGGAAYAVEANGGEVTDGASFVSALGGNATYTLEGDKYIVALADDVELTNTILIKSGSYVLAGEGEISRAGGYAGALLKLSDAASLEVSGSVALDGGAAWEGAEEPGSAVGATGNSGVSGAGPLVHSLGGRVAISGGAELRSNDGGSAILSEAGEVSIAGGSVHGISTSSPAAVAVTGDSGSVSVSGGRLWGNRSTGGYCSCVWVRGGSLDVTGGEISGNSGQAAVSAQRITVTGGSLSGNSGPAIEPMSLGSRIEVSGGAFMGNGGCAVACASVPVSVSGGTFSGNAGAVSAGSLALSGNPVFGTDTDTVSAPVGLAGALGDGVVVRLSGAGLSVGDKAVSGDEGLVAQHHGKFLIVGDGGLVVNAQGRVDTDPSSLVNDGEALAAALGGTCAVDPATGAFTVELDGDVALRNAIFLESGSYVLAGEGEISRAGGYAGALLKLSDAASLEVSGSVALDGGAAWEGAEEPGSAVGATGNSGVSGAGPLVHSLGGAVALSGGAELRNNDGYAVLSEAGEVSIAGGSVHGISSSTVSAAVAITGDSGSVSVSGGRLWGNRNLSPWGGSSCVWVRGGSLDVTGGEISGNSGEDAASAQLVTVTGGTFSGNDGSAIAPMSAAGRIEVSGGAFEGNGGCAVAGGGRYVKVSGGAFSGNAGAVPAGSELSGSPVFGTDTDTVSAPVGLAGALGDGVVVRLVPTSYSAGTVVVQGTSSYSMTDSDAAKFSLTSAAPQGTYLSFNPEHNQIVITVKTPILLEATVNESVYYDGQPVVPGQDFSVSIYEYVNEEKGEEITGNYTVGGGALNVEFKYREANSTGDYATGLPTDAGAYTVLATAAADNANSRASGSMTFPLTIAPKPIAFNIGSLPDVYYTGDTFTPEPEVSSPDVAELVKGRDYEYRYEGNLEPGTCVVTVIGIGSYSGSVSTQFEILAIPVMVEVQAPQGPIFYDGQPVAPGDGFTVRVYEYKDGVKGAEITADYAVGGSPALTFAYRASGSQNDFAEGLPAEAGAYTVRATAGEDAANRRSGASADFELTIVKVFTVTWMNGLETLEIDENVSEGDTPSYGGEEPARTADAQYTYSFAGWATEDGRESGAVVADLPLVTADATYYAAFSKAVNMYTVTFTDGQGNTLSIQEVPYGGSATAPEDSKRDGFAFRGWDVDFSNITGDLTVNALWTKAYTVTWKNGGDTLETDENVPEGSNPVYDGDEPAKAPTDQYRYAFSGWATQDGQESGAAADALPLVTGDATYYAAFSKTVNVYTVIFADGQGGVLSTQQVEYGAAAEAPADPVREGFAFAGWDADFSAVTSDFEVNALWRDVSSADEVVALIEALPAPADVTAADEAAVAAAQAAYGALPDDDRAYVDAACGAKLADVAAALQAAKDAAAAAAAEAAAPVVALVEALPAPADVTVADEAAVEEARVAYEALPPEARALVDAACGSKLQDVAAALQAAKDSVVGPAPAPAKAKAANPMTAKAKKAVKVKASKLRKKAQKIARAKAITVTGAKGKVTYRLKSVKKAKFKKYFKVAAKSGKIKVKKGLKKGTYRLKIAVTAAGDAAYESVTRTVTVKVRVG